MKFFCRYTNSETCSLTSYAYIMRECMCATAYVARNLRFLLSLWGHMERACIMTIHSFAHLHCSSPYKSLITINIFFSNVRLVSQKLHHFGPWWCWNAKKSPVLFCCQIWHVCKRIARMLSNQIGDVALWKWIVVPLIYCVNLNFLQ
jgi:hypothetical protein